MKTYDCILFLNEFDLLELRLKTLDAVVDYFVIVEAPWTFSGKEKPLHFKDNCHVFDRWASKIRHVILEGYDRTKDAWYHEWTARWAMEAGFRDAEPVDWIFQSDCDEIWRPEKRDEMPDERAVVYGMGLFYYYLNARRVPEIGFRGTRRCQRRNWPGGQPLRNVTEPIIQNGGWHFSFLGDAKDAAEKMKAYSHVEYSKGWWTNEERIDHAIRSGADLIRPGVRYDPIAVDETFPKPVLEDPERWQKHVLALPS